MRQNRTGLVKAGQPIQKAARLIAEHRVRLAPSAEVYVVQGDHGTYKVIADADGILCPCEARTPLCAHVLAVARVCESERQAALAAAHRAGNGRTEGEVA